MKNVVVLRVVALLLGSCLSVVAGAQSTEKKPAAAVKKTAAKAKAAALPTIVWRGDRCTERAFVRDLAREFEASKQGRVELQPFSTISGLDAVHDGNVDIAGTSRPAMPGREEEKDLTFYPVAWDALVMITSPKNPVNDVSLKQLYEIYLGHVTNWRQLGGDDTEINLYAVASPLDGNEYSLRKLLYHDGDQAVSVPRLYVNTIKLEEGITIDPHGLGVSTLSSVAANRAIKILTVEGYSASTASVTDGTYPLYSTLFLASRDNGRNQASVEQFVRFTGSDTARALLRRHELVPYDEAPALFGKQDERVAFIDAHINPEAVAAASASTTPVSAPIATADYLSRMAPTAETTQQAKERAAKARADMAADKGKAAGQTQPDGDAGH